MSSDPTLTVGKKVSDHELRGEQAPDVRCRHHGKQPPLP